MEDEKGLGGCLGVNPYLHRGKRVLGGRNEPATSNAESPNKTTPNPRSSVRPGFHACNKKKRGGKGGGGEEGNTRRTPWTLRPGIGRGGRVIGIRPKEKEGRGREKGGRGVFHTL